MSMTEHASGLGNSAAFVSEARLGHSIQFAQGYWVIEMQRANRRNALDESFADALSETFSMLGTKAPGAPAILCAEGSAFCAGADISFLTGVPPSDRDSAFAERAKTLTPALVRLIEAVQQSSLVTIAAVQGAASGGGWSLALACDFRVAATNSIFWFPEVEYGRPLSERTLALLLSHVGRARATEIALAAKRYTAHELVLMGLVNQVVTTEELQPSARKLAQQLAGMSPAGMAMTKHRINRLSGAQN
jgi:enoyl-CoA hydratase